MSDGACERCGKEFGLPVKLTVMSGGPDETYSACPFCFSKVRETKAETAVRPAVVKKHEDGMRGEETMEAVGVVARGCSHNLGYLRGRVKNAAIPEECLVCPKILQCMT